MKFAGNEKGIVRWPNATINLFLTKPLLYYSSVLLTFFLRHQHFSQSTARPRGIKVLFFRPSWQFLISSIFTISKFSRCSALCK